MKFAYSNACLLICFDYKNFLFKNEIVMMIKNCKHFILLIHVVQMLERFVKQLLEFVNSK